MDKIAALSPAHQRIVRVIVKLLEHYGAPLDVLCILNSWGDSLEEEDIAKYLEEIEETGGLGIIEQAE